MSKQFIAGEVLPLVSARFTILIVRIKPVKLFLVGVSREEKFSYKMEAWLQIVGSQLVGLEISETVVYMVLS